jgi:hypothetical protein
MTLELPISDFGLYVVSIVCESNLLLMKDRDVFRLKFNSRCEIGVLYKGRFIGGVTTSLGESINTGYVLLCTNFYETLCLFLKRALN